LEDLTQVKNSTAMGIPADSIEESPITLIIQVPEEIKLISHIIGKGKVCLDHKFSLIVVISSLIKRPRVVVSGGSNINAVMTSSGCKVQVRI